MDLVILVAIMIVVGLLIGRLAGFIWKDNRPIGVSRDYIAAVITAVLVGLIDWYVIPAMGFTNTIKYLGVAVEPALGALIVLWIIRAAKR